MPCQYLPWYRCHVADMNITCGMVCWLLAPLSAIASCLPRVLDKAGMDELRAMYLGVSSSSLVCMTLTMPKDLHAHPCTLWRCIYWRWHRFVKGGLFGAGSGRSVVGIAGVHLSILKCITSALKCHPGSPRSAKSLSSRIAVQNLWKPSQSRPIRVPLSNSQRALQRNAEKKYYEDLWRNHVTIHNAYSCASYNMCSIIYC